MKDDVFDEHPNEIDHAVRDLERAARENSAAPLALHRHALALFVLAEVLPASEAALIEMVRRARDESTWVRPPYPEATTIQATVSYYERVLGHGRQPLPLDLITASHILAMEECRGEFAAQLLAHIKKVHGTHWKAVEDFLRRHRRSRERVADDFGPLFDEEVPPKGEDVQ